MRTRKLGIRCALALVAASFVGPASGDTLQPVAELGYRVDPEFFRDSEHLDAGEASGIALNSPDQHVWMVDGGYDRIIEMDQNGKILGAIGEPGHAPGQLAWGHFLVVTPERKILVADVLNWRFQVFVPAPSSHKTARYVPSKRMFWDRVQ